MLSKKRIRSFLFYFRSIRTVLSKLRLEEMPEGKNIFVIAPHPDDDAIGCGGSILLHVAAGHQVNILYLTDGEHGLQEIDLKTTAITRRSEAIKAALHLGVQVGNLHYLHLQDGNLSNQTGANETLQILLKKLKPDTIYLPSFFENHPDHYASNMLLLNNLDFRVHICAYEVWTPLIPNILVNISSVMPAKLLAIREHASQIKALDYHEAMEGLNRYRAAMFSREAKYAEAFISCNSAEYFKLMQRS